MKQLLRNSLLLNKFKITIAKTTKQMMLLGGLLFCLSLKAQIVNYVNNGGFEIPNPNNLQKAKYWDGIDTSKYNGLMLSYTISPYWVPASGFTYQWPFKDNNYYISTLFLKPSTPNTLRGYPRNKLKQNLQNGVTYCVKFYANISNQSSYGVDGLGAYFGDNNLDTIKLCDKPISYLSPQIQNVGILTDTLNWVLIQGTFTANGNEKYMMLGNFKSDVATNTLLINPTNLPLIFSDVLYDNVSCIDINLPAFAGRDTFFIPGDSIYLGRPSDVGIDEDCMWYKLPNTTTAIDTIAGMWVKPTTTCTYVVKQDICGVIKWDTVVLYQSAIGVNELELISNNLKIYPQPAQDVLNIQMNVKTKMSFNHVMIFDHLGQIIREEEINFIDNKAILGLNNLSNGIYIISFNNQSNETITKKLVITY